MADNQKDSANHPRIEKQPEFDLMCGFIELGLWRTNNLAQACNVNKDTITVWKTYPEAQKAYNKAVQNALKKRIVKGDVDKDLKELNLEVDPDQVDVKTTFTWKTDEPSHTD